MPDGIPDTNPDQQGVRQLIFSYNFAPIDGQFFDRYEYASGVKVYTVAKKNKHTRLQILVDEGFP